MEKKSKKISVCIYDFMRELGLRGTSLLVYAFIYSYRKSEAGFFYGKRQFIADECGISRRSVERGISKLLALGLIEKLECGRYKGLRVTEEHIPEKQSKKNSNNDGSLEYGYDIFSEEAQSYRTDIKPKYNIVELGRYITMTREQCEALLSLVPITELESYVAKMDRMLENNMASGIQPPKNFYRTLKKWILDDCKL